MTTDATIKLISLYQPLEGAHNAEKEVEENYRTDVTCLCKVTSSSFSNQLL